MLCFDNTQKYHHAANKRRISTRWNNRQLHREIIENLFCHKTIFNFHVNDFGTNIENKAGFFVFNEGVYM